MGSPVRKQSMFKDIFEEPKEQDGERKIEVFSKASRIPSKPSGVGLAEMMKSRLLNRTDSDKEVVVEQEVIRRRSVERSPSRSRSRSRNERENKKKSKGKKNKSRSRSKERKKKKKYSRSSSSPASSPEKRKKKKKKHKVKQEEAESSRSRSGTREE